MIKSKLYALEIYIGGTGKTPATLKLNELLKDKNYKVESAKKFYSNQQDEYLLLKNKSQIISLKNRKEIIKHAIEKNYELIIFDDGLQDKTIDYNLKFVCFEVRILLGMVF